MDLKGRIIAGKITSADQLEPIARRIVGLEPELSSLIDENVALSKLVADCTAPPCWDDLRFGVLGRAREIRAAQLEAEQIEQMPPFQRLLRMQPWVPRAAVAMVVLIALCILLGSLPNERGASSPPARLAQSDIEWFNYSLASSYGRCTNIEQQNVNHP